LVSSLVCSVPTVAPASLCHSLQQWLCGPYAFQPCPLARVARDRTDFLVSTRGLFESSTSTDYRELASRARRRTAGASRAVRLNLPAVYQLHQQSKPGRRKRLGRGRPRRPLLRTMAVVQRRTRTIQLRLLVRSSTLPVIRPPAISPPCLSLCPATPPHWRGVHAAESGATMKVHTDVTCCLAPYVLIKNFIVLTFGPPMEVGELKII
jgi:hypothetical protein